MALPHPRSSFARLDLTTPVPVVVVDADEWLDLATADALARVLEQVLRLRPPVVHVDLSRCPAADVHGLRVIERFRVRAATSGTQVLLVGPNAQVRRVLALTGLDAVLPVAPGALSRRR
jgi:anti-anti-sigma factor